MKRILLSMAAILVCALSFGQTREELKAEQAAKKDSVAAIQGRVDALQGQIDAFPGWKKGLFGTIGANLSGANDWFSQGVPNNDSGNIGIGLTGFANLDRDKFFWRNSGIINLQWVKIDDEDDPLDDDGFRGATDVFTLTSLYGYKLNSKFAISALGEYRTSIINNFNDPGYLDVGVGATWTPITDLVVVIHPLNYNFVFAENDAAFESSLGAKIVVDYTKQLGKVSFKTNYSTFQSYDTSDLSNWTWINSFGYTLWNGIGIGLEFGLRGNRQEAFANALDQAGVDPNLAIGDVDSPTQSYYLFGINYSL